MCGLQFLKDIIIQGKDTFVKLVKAQTWCRVYCLCVSLSPRYISGWLGTRLGMRFVWLCICAFYFLHFLAKYERACCWLWTGLSTPKLCSFCLDLHLGIFRVHLASEIVWGGKNMKIIPTNLDIYIFLISILGSSACIFSAQLSRSWEKQKNDFDVAFPNRKSFSLITS